MAGELLALVVGPDKGQLARVTIRIQKIVAKSFEEDRSRVTRSEVVRRFGFVETLLRELRAEHGWAFERILDEMSYALRCKLDGHPWEPNLQRNAWSV